jgi:hypothetical protein
MHVHKFGTKFKSDNERQPLTIRWRPVMNLLFSPEKLNPTTWQIFCQEKITFKRKEAKTVSIAFGVEMSDGMVLVSLNQLLKSKQCSMLDASLIESVEDIIVTITNNSETNVLIQPGEKLCCIHYVN